MVPYDIWAEIDLAAVEQNVRNLREALSPGTKLMAVVKADGYGHGAVPVASSALAAGADCLAVARMGEAIELRHAGIKCPILIFGHVVPGLASKLLDYNLTQTVSSFKYARELSDLASAEGATLRVHVNIDTGMGRLGVMGAAGESRWNSAGAVDEIEAICGLKGLAVQGVYTHFATADEREKTNARAQFKLFERILSVLRQRGIVFEFRHAANSAAALDMPETHMDMVRLGISIYGHYPSEETKNRHVKLVPAMTVRARIVHLKEVGPGFKVSYGWTGQTRDKTIIATVAAGYADGFSRLFSSSGFMLVRGCRAPVIGRVCMDNVMLDVGHVPNVACGDAALVFGRDEKGEIPVETLAGMLGTINYEILSGISSRVPRIYHKASLDTS
ncbi:MAG: alanine racemase [Desulfobacterales bacterium]